MPFKRHRWTISLCVCLALLILLIPPVVALRTSEEQVPCVENPECHSETPPSTVVPEPASAQQTLWGGFSDGRLNPDMAEYYSVWCGDNRILVLRAVPSPDTVAEILLAAVNAMSDGGSLAGANNLTVTRSGDTITLSGSNGNSAPQPGSKSFSLAQCNERNGGAPPPAEPPVAPINPPAPPPAQNAADNQAANDNSRCLDQLYFDFHRFECGDAPDNGISLLWRLLSDACPGMGIVPISFTSVVGFRSLRKRR